MSKYEVELTFTAYITVEGESESEAIENAIDKARDNYGSEVADFGEFKLTREEVNV
jgi:hypothetical protein